MILSAMLAWSTGCAATRLEHTWTNPNVRAVNLNRVAVVAFTRNPSRRRMMEDSMAAELRQAAPDVKAVPSYSVLSDADLWHETRARQQLQRAGYDGVVALRVTDVDRSDVYVPGSTVVAPVYYRTFWGYYRHWVPIMYEPGYVERDRDVQVETEVYAMRTDTLVYSAVSRTLNPASAQDLAADVTHVVAKDLKDRGLLFG